MVTVGIFPFKENSHGRAGNQTRDLMISSQRLWPLDHEAGPDSEGSAGCLDTAGRFDLSKTLGFKFQLPPWTDFFFFFSLGLPEMPSRLYGALRTAACEGLKVRTMHRGRHKGLNIRNGALIAVFWAVMRCGLVDTTDVSDGHQPPP